MGRKQTTRGVFHSVPAADDFVLTDHGLFVMDDAPIVSLEYHESLEVGLCHEGSGIFVVGSKVLPFRAGDASIIAPGEIHFAQSQRGTRSTWTFLFADINQFVLPRYPELATFDIGAYSGHEFRNVVSPRDHAGLVEAIRTLVREVRQRRSGYRSMAVSCLAMLAVLLRREFTGSSSARETQAVRSSLDRVRSAVEHITGHYHERVEVGTLARLCNTSPRNFTRLFAEAFHRTPHEYLTDTRIAMACSHLLKKDTPIALVAEECGFFTITSFNRAFKARMGVSPRDWRSRHRDL